MTQICNARHHSSQASADFGEVRDLQPQNNEQMMEFSVVTGASSYAGKQIAQRLPALGQAV